MSFQSQPPESSGNGKTTLKKGGREPPNVCLDCIVCDLLSYFNEIEQLRDAEKEAEKKYDIVKEHDCWPADDIKRAWGKTQRMEKESLRRRHWTLVIMLKMIERQRKGLFDMTEVGHLVDDRRSTVDMRQCGTCGKEQSMKVNPEDRSTQNNAELETVVAAGGVKQCSGGKHTSSTNHGQTDSVIQGQTGTQSPARSKDTGNNPGAPDGQSRTNVSASSESEEAKNTKNQENIYICIPFSQMFGREYQTEHDQKKEITDSEPTSNPHTDQTASCTKNYKLTDGVPLCKEIKDPSCKEIRDPSCKEIRDPSCKEIRDPSCKEIRVKKSYVLSYDKERKNAEWVYEILTKNTLPNVKVKVAKKDKSTKRKDPRCKILNSSAPDDKCGTDVSAELEHKEVTKMRRLGLKTFTEMKSGESTSTADQNARTNNVLTDRNQKETKEEHHYHKGHLAAAANHNWCKDAYSNTFMFSNLAPQHKDINTGQWKEFENKCRNKAVEEAVRNVHVYTGPIYMYDLNPKLEKGIMESFDGKKLPSHFFKVVIVEFIDGRVAEPECIIRANMSSNLEYLIKPYVSSDPKFKIYGNISAKELHLKKVSIELIEKWSGLKFIDSSLKKKRKDSLRKVTWFGESANGESCSAEIAVSISS